MMKTKILYGIILVSMGLMIAACRKDKEDVRVGNLPDNNYNAKSTVRIISINDAVDLMVGNMKLTNWKYASGGLPAMPYPTPYFSTTGKLKGAYSLPQQFLDKSGEAIVKLYDLADGTTVLRDSFQVQENYNQPRDYYINTSEDHKVSIVPRSITAPKDPSHIRIRLVNLSALTQISNGKEKLSLTYADGSIVNTVTSGIGQGSWSDYVELPYGTYQFKVIVMDKPIQLPGKPPILTNVSSPTDVSLNTSQVFYAPVKSFQPGGVYTIVVATSGGFQFGDAGVSANCFSVITDIEPTANVTYGRLQAINAADKNGIKLQIDGVLTDALAYGKAGDYATLIKGNHDIKITDASGKVVVQKNISINSGDNLSLWVYPLVNGNAEMLTVQNNMTGLRNITTYPDGSDNGQGVYDPLRVDMELQTRFLNLCPDLPYITFTGDNGKLFSENKATSSALAAQNLQPGQLPDKAMVPYPYVDMGYSSGGTVNVYRSRPGVVPGDRLMETNALKTADFVRMPSQFFNNGRFIAEPGIYTVALIGRSNTGRQPEMIVIKHNR